MLPESRKDNFLHHYSVSRETIDRLEKYEQLLQKRGETLSLVGRSTFDGVWDRHFLDSAQLLPHCPADKPVIDMGSGAGFPGMVLSILGHRNVHLIENNQQKVAFLREVAAAVAAPVTIHNVKIEALKPFRSALVTARALAPLDSLLNLGQSMFLNQSSGLFLKGKNASIEIAAARKHWDFELETFPSLTSADSSILRLTSIQRKT